MAHVYTSKNGPKSKILKTSLTSRLSAIFGYRPASEKSKAESDIASRYGIDFVRVDINNDQYRFKNAALGNVFESHGLSENLEKLFDAYMDETSLSYDNIQDRQKRLNELSFVFYNDPFVQRVVELVGAEATQIDQQNRIISVESPNLNFCSKVYDLLTQWGVTQDRIQGVCRDLELYGESFWTHKVGLNGIEKIMPIRPNSVMERLEFSPVKMSEYLAQRDGWAFANKNRSSKIHQLIDNLQGDEAMDYGENLADMFDNKLLGYELQGEILCPPWSMTHFRYNSENSEFYPYGRPPLLGCLAPFKQSYSSMMLQGLARSMSFPITMYKVKSTEGMGPEIAFEHVNTVREEYDNLGVTPSSAGGEVYTVNTKMWVPESLVDIDVKESKCDIDFVGDIELYQDRVAIASGVPKAYLDQEFGGFGNSGISLTEQYKPFARHVYTIQSSFLQGLGELIRLHFAITGEFDYNTPFILSMRFPADEMSTEKREARSASLEMTQSIIELMQSSLGLEEGESLPEDVMTDILSKYSFLDPTDIQKWMRLSSYLKPISTDSEDGDDSDMDFGADDSGDLDMGNDTGGDDLDSMPESNLTLSDKKTLRERAEFLKEVKRKRIREVRERYKETKEDIFFHFIESQHLTEYQNTTKHEHVLYVPKLTESNPLMDSIKVLRSESPTKTLRENVSPIDMINKADFEHTDAEDDKLQERVEEQALGVINNE